MKRFWTVRAAVLITASISFAFAQSKAPGFDVAAIHLSSGIDPTKGLIDYSGTQLRATSVSLTALLKFAYQVRDHQILGGPDWIKSATFDIAAGPITAGVPGLPNTQRMLQSMLADRFALQLHRETKAPTCIPVGHLQGRFLNASRRSQRWDSIPICQRVN